MSELRGLQLRTDEFLATGAQVAAVCVDSPEQNRQVAESLGIHFPILSDPELRAIDAFDLRHAGGSPYGGDISRPALYLIDEGVVKWRELTDNWRVRAPPEEVVRAARRIFAGS